MQGQIKKKCWSLSFWIRYKIIKIEAKKKKKQKLNRIVTCSPYCVCMYYSVTCLYLGNFYTFSVPFNKKINKQHAKGVPVTLLSSRDVHWNQKKAWRWLLRLSLGISSNLVVGGLRIVGISHVTLGQLFFTGWQWSGLVMLFSEGTVSYLWRHIWFEKTHLVLRFVFVFGCALWLAGSQFPDQGLNLGRGSDTPSPNHWATREFSYILAV